MSTQWHPLFAYLLRLRVDAYYEVRSEVPVSDLPRRADVLVIRRTGVSPPFVGLWGRLTPWNVAQFKGPTDDPDRLDLELLVHVATGLTYRENEDRRESKRDPLANREVSLWYFAYGLGETFLGDARLLTSLTYETDGVWRGQVWGHPLTLVNCKDLPVEPDTVPLHLLRRDPDSPPRQLGQVVAGSPEMAVPYAAWLHVLQPHLWKEFQQMALSNASAEISIDWKSLKEHLDVDNLIKGLGPEWLIPHLSSEDLLKHLVPHLSPDDLLKHLTPEQRAALRQRLQDENPSNT